MSARSLYRIAVVGAGPAGLYTTKALLRGARQSLASAITDAALTTASELSPPPLQVDVFDRLPTPFGLVRSGVAPDHPHTKNVQNELQHVLDDNRVAFYGNVHIEDCSNDSQSPKNSTSPHVHIPFNLLTKNYDAVVLAYGAGMFAIHLQ